MKNEFLRSCKKWYRISTDVKADVKQQDLKYTIYNIKQVFAKNSEWWGEVLLNGRNPLSLTKVICQQSLTHQLFS